MLYRFSVTVNETPPVLSAIQSKDLSLLSIGYVTVAKRMFLSLASDTCLAKSGEYDAKVPGAITTMTELAGPLLLVRVSNIYKD